jgi:transcriptional regulator GlxA family with amidase domain
MAKIRDKRVEDVIAFMQDNLSQGLALSTLSKGVNLSSAQLNHIFKAELGVTALQYLKSLRLKKAQELLDNTYLTVKEIAVAVGLNDVSHFVRDFKMSYGLTPAQYRKRLVRRERARQ